MAEKLIEKIIGYECKECIKLFGYEEMRCAFCKDKEYFKESVMPEEIKDSISEILTEWSK